MRRPTRATTLFCYHCMFHGSFAGLAGLDYVDFAVIAHESDRFLESVPISLIYV